MNKKKIKLIKITNLIIATAWSKVASKKKLIFFVNGLFVKYKINLINIIEINFKKTFLSKINLNHVSKIYHDIDIFWLYHINYQNKSGNEYLTN